MNTFRKKWNNKSVEDWGIAMSDEAKSFVKGFRNMLKRQLEPEGIEVSLEPNHYDCSGFLCKDNKYIYISYSIPRGGEKIDFDDSSYLNGVLYRTAKNDRDFTGGSNRFSSISNLPRKIIEMFDNYDRYTQDRL